LAENKKNKSVRGKGGFFFRSLVHKRGPWTVGDCSVVEDKRLTANGTPARRQATDAGGRSGDRRVSTLADTTTARHGRRNQGRGLEHAWVGHRHGRMSKPLH